MFMHKHEGYRNNTHLITNKCVVYEEVPAVPSGLQVGYSHMDYMNKHFV